MSTSIFERLALPLDGSGFFPHHYVRVNRS